MCDSKKVVDNLLLNTPILAKSLLKSCYNVTGKINVFVGKMSQRLKMHFGCVKFIEKIDWLNFYGCKATIKYNITMSIYAC